MTTTPQPERSPWPALWALIIGFFMILVDSTIVSVAVPAIMRGLDADISQVIWVTSAYLLAYAVPLLITGRLGDRFGPKNMYLLGLTIFTLSSAACGLANSIEVLIVARAVQGLGAALLTPQTMAIITRTFPPNRRGAAMGLWGSTAGAAILVGPIVGGLLVDHLGWEWIFFVNVPVGVIGFVLAARLVPKLQTHSHTFDLLGVLLSAAGMFCLVFGLEEGENYNWGTIKGPISVWSLIITGIVVLGLFVVWQKYNRAEPLVPLGLFADRNFCAAGIGIFAMGFIVTAMAFPLILFAQVARGLSPTDSALLMLPNAVLTAALSPFVGRHVNNHSARPVAVAGFVLFGLSLAWYAYLMQPGINILWQLAPSALMGIAGTGIWGPLSVSATRNLPPHRAGAGAGVYNTIRQIGAVLGSAAIAALMQQRLTSELPGSSSSGTSGMWAMASQIPAALEAGFSKAMSQSMLLPAGLAVLGLLGACVLVWRPGAQPTAGAAARELSTAELAPLAAVDGHGDMNGHDTMNGRGLTSSDGSALIEYPFPLRPGLQAKLMLPEDVTDHEAERLTRYLQSLAVTHDWTSPTPESAPLTAPNDEPTYVPAER